MEILEMGFDKRIKLYGDEFITVHIKEIHQVDNVDEQPMGSQVGFVKLVYPIGGVDCNLQLELYKQEIEYTQDFCRDEDTYDVSFKIPFSLDKNFVEELIYNKWEEDSWNHYKDMEDEYEKCQCGGFIMPMYEEFPNWITFCNKCDARMENFDSSPLPY